MGEGRSDRHKITVLFFLPTMSPSDASPSVRMTTAAFLPSTDIKRRDKKRRDKKRRDMKRREMKRRDMKRRGMKRRNKMIMIVIRLRRLQCYSVQVITGKQSSYLLRVAEAR